jgi:hypothetical protein
VGRVTVPAEVVIDRLVLSGIAAQDAPAVVEAFRRHLARMLTGPSASADDVMATAGDSPERYGQQLAAAVARSILRAGVT